MPQRNFSWRPTNAPFASSRTDDIWFNDARTGWAVNSDGKILRTDDGGDTWDEQKLLPNFYLRCVGFAPDGRTGWVGTIDPVTHRLHSTRDGGATWAAVNNLPPIPVRICGLCVVDERTIYASGTNEPEDQAAVLKSTDGGNTWTAIDLGGQAELLVDIYFRDEDEGWVVGGKNVVNAPGRPPDRADVIATVLHTKDGGQTWTALVSSLDGQLPKGEWGWKFQHLDADTQLVSLESMTRGAILRTDDRGRSWRRLPVDDPQGNVNLEGIGFLDKDRGWVGGWGDRFFRSGKSSVTSDGGASWQNASEIGKYLNRFRFIGSPVEVAYASGDTVYKYTDAPLPSPATMAAARAARESRVLSGRDGAVLTFNVGASDGALRMIVWNRFGKRVRTLEEAAPAARQRVEWDYADDAGQPVPAGAYIVRVTQRSRSESRIVVREP